MALDDQSRTGPGPSNHGHAYRYRCLPSVEQQHAVVATEFFCPSIVMFLSKSSIECSTGTVPMSDIVDVGLICNRMAVFGINSTRNAVRKCKIALGFASHYFTLPDCIARAINPKYQVDHPITYTNRDIFVLKVFRWLTFNQQKLNRENFPSLLTAWDCALEASTQHAWRTGWLPH